MSPKGVLLKPLTVADLDNVMTWVNDHETLSYFANRQKDITRDEERKYIEHLVASKTDLAYSIFFRDEGDETYLGQCSLNQIYWPAGNGRLFVVIRKEAQGWGYGTEAIKELLKKAWDELNLHKVFLIVRKDNRHAQAKYLKLGFDFEGILRDEYCVNGKYYDMVRMGIVRPTTV
jgi:RimJ/RimL family protein N-acetyltransferase